MRAKHGVFFIAHLHSDQVAFFKPEIMFSLVRVFISFSHYVCSSNVCLTSEIGLLSSTKNIERMNPKHSIMIFISKSLGEETTTPWGLNIITAKIKAPNEPATISKKAEYHLLMIMVLIVPSPDFVRNGVLPYLGGLPSLLIAKSTMALKLVFLLEFECVRFG